MIDLAGKAGFRVAVGVNCGDLHVDSAGAAAFAAAVASLTAAARAGIAVPAEQQLQVGQHNVVIVVQVGAGVIVGVVAFGAVGGQQDLQVAQSDFAHRRRNRRGNWRRSLGSELAHSSPGC